MIQTPYILRGDEIAWLERIEAFGDIGEWELWGEDDVRNLKLFEAEGLIETQQFDEKYWLLTKRGSDAIEAGYFTAYSLPPNPLHR